MWPPPLGSHVPKMTNLFPQVPLDHVSGRTQEGGIILANWKKKEIPLYAKRKNQWGWPPVFAFRRIFSNLDCTTMAATMSKQLSLAQFLDIAEDEEVSA